MVVPSLGILSLGTISTIAASCSCSNTILQDAFVESGDATVNYEEMVLSCKYKILVSDVHGNIVYHGVVTINFSFWSGTSYKVLKIHETNKTLYGWSVREFANDDYWGLRDEINKTWISRQDLSFSLQVRTSNDKYLQGNSPITISNDGQVNWNVNVSRQTTFAYKVGVTYNDFTFWSYQKLITICLVNDYFDVSISGIVFPTVKLMNKWTSNFKYLNDGLLKSVLWSNNYYNVDSITYIADSSLKQLVLQELMKQNTTLEISIYQD